MILVDDHVVAARLASGGVGAVAGRELVPGEVATTCSWWWRLSSALAGEHSGALSSYFAALGPGARLAVSRVVGSLPSRLVILDIRDLIPAMAVLSGEHMLNQLAAEAVVAAEVLQADLVVGRDTPKIRETAGRRGLPYRVETL
ncbi:MAG: hypothetical protein ACRDXE_09355 [Acidimicrobiales bacterium]